MPSAHYVAANVFYSAVIADFLHAPYKYDYCYYFVIHDCHFQCFDTVGWVSGTASSLQKIWVLKCRLKWFACGTADTTTTCHVLFSVESRMVYLLLLVYPAFMEMGVVIILQLHCFSGLFFRLTCHVKTWIFVIIRLLHYLVQSLKLNCIKRLLKMLLNLVCISLNTAYSCVYI